MPRVHFVKKAQKDNPAVKKGESYYHWSFRYGGKHYSKSLPKPAQLTQSEYLCSMYEHQDTCGDIGTDDLEEAASSLNDLASEVREVGDECAEKLENMPEGFQQGTVGELLSERIEQCEQIAQELEDAASTIAYLQEDADKTEEAKCQEAQDHIDGVSWEFS